MKNRLTAVIAAAAIALTSATAAPVFADSKSDKQVLTLLLGAAALGLIISESNKKKSRVTVTKEVDNGYYRDYPADRDQKKNRGDRYGRVIPAECAFPIRGRDGRTEVVSARCVSDLGMGRNLPRECAFDISGRYGPVRVYGARCLHQNGYRIAANKY